MGSSYTSEDFRDELNDLEQGILKEKACLEFYAREVEQLAEPSLRSLYGWFISCTQARIQALETLREDVAGSGAWLSGMGARLEAAEKSAGEAPALEVEAGRKPERAAIISLRQAINLEKQAASIYFTAVRRAREANVRELWSHLARQKEARIGLLESSFERLLQLALGKS